MKKAVGPIGALFALLLFIAFPSSAQATDDVYFELYYGTGTQLCVELETDTPGALIFFRLQSNGQGYPDDPSHTGSTPNSPTMRYYGRVCVPYGQIYYFSAVAWTSSEGDSNVTTWEQPNPNL